MIFFNGIFRSGLSRNMQSVESTHLYTNNFPYGFFPINKWFFQFLSIESQNIKKKLWLRYQQVECLRVIKWIYCISIEWCTSNDKAQSRQNKNWFNYLHFCTIHSKMTNKLRPCSVIVSIWPAHHHVFKTNCINKARFVYKRRALKMELRRTTAMLVAII